MPIAPLTDNQIDMRKLGIHRHFRLMNKRQTIVHQTPLITQNVFKLKATLNHRVPAVFIELGRSISIVIHIPVVEMQIITIDFRLTIFDKTTEEVLGPLHAFARLVTVRTARDGIHFRRREHIGGEAWHSGCEPAVFVKVGLRRHGTASSPHFVANAPIFHTVRCFMAVGLTFLGQIGGLLTIAVFHPILHFGHSTGKHVDIDPRFRAEHFAQTQEFVGAEAVIVEFVRGEVFIKGGFTFALRPHAVTPMVGVCVATARPTNNRRLQCTQSIQCGLAVAMLVFNRGILPYPQTFINAFAKEFNELAMQFRIDTTNRTVRVNADNHGLLLCSSTHICSVRNSYSSCSYCAAQYVRNGRRSQER